MGEPGQLEAVALVERLRLAMARNPATAPDLDCESPTDRMALMGAYGVPKRITRATRAIQRNVGSEPIKPVMVVEKWLAKPAAEAWALVLSGKPGTGKSVAAGLALWESTAWVPRGGQVRRWWHASELLALAPWRDNRTGEFVLERLGEVGLLVLDDVGTELKDKSGSLTTRLDFIIDARYRDDHRLLITTNLSRAAFTERYGERIIQRIEDGGAFYEFKGPVLRGQK